MKKLLVVALSVNAALLLVRVVQELPRHAEAAPSEYILDNGQPGTSSTGDWKPSRATGFYGTGSVYGNNGPVYTWTFSGISTGQYDVYAWWTVLSSRGTAVPYSVVHSSGTATVNVNQQTNGGQWNLLGTFTFGTTAVVRVTAVGTVSTCADAVRIVAKTPPPGATLTPEQAEILSHMSIVYLPTDDAGHTAKAIRFTGVNVQVVNGLGATNGRPGTLYDDQDFPVRTNSLGNLIIGYHETRDGTGAGWLENRRTGSHNLVVGPRHNYTSCGAVVAGYWNSAEGLSASIGGGVFNTVTAGAYHSAVGGGVSNVASGEFSWVGGGHGNNPSGPYSCVSGGIGNTASAFHSTVSGGVDCHASGMFSTVSGGRGRSVDGEADWRAGDLFQDQ